MKMGVWGVKKLLFGSLMRVVADNDERNVETLDVVIIIG